jgi:hypothetical protein
MGVYLWFSLSIGAAFGADTVKGFVRCFQALGSISTHNRANTEPVEDGFLLSRTDGIDVFRLNASGVGRAFSFKLPQEKERSARCTEKFGKAAYCLKMGVPGPTLRFSYLLYTITNLGRIDLLVREGPEPLGETDFSTLYIDTKDSAAVERGREALARRIAGIGPLVAAGLKGKDAAESARLTYKVEKALESCRGETEDSALLEELSKATQEVQVWSRMQQIRPGYRDPRDEIEASPRGRGAREPHDW